MKHILLAACLVFTSSNAVLAQNNDDYTPYYAPEITSQEVFDRVLLPSPQANRHVRVSFTTEITKSQLAAPETPQFVIFAKGNDASRLYIVATDDEVFKTLYRARAVLAQLTSTVRGNFFASQPAIATRATFFDLLQMLHFDEVVLSDGVTWTHRVMLERS